MEDKIDFIQFMADFQKFVEVSPLYSDEERPVKLRNLALMAGWQTGFSLGRWLSVLPIQTRFDLTASSFPEEEGFCARVRVNSSNCGLTAFGNYPESGAGSSEFRVCVGAIQNLMESQT